MLNPHGRVSEKSKCGPLLKRKRDIASFQMVSED